MSSVLNATSRTPDNSSYHAPAGSADEPDPSQAQCLALLVPALQQLPPLNQLSAFLNQPLPSKIRVSPAVFRSIRDSDLEISQSFQPSFHIDHQLQDLASRVIQHNPHLGGEPLTAGAVDRSLLDMLLSIDQLLPIQSSMRVNFQIQRDQADSDSQMTVRSATGSSLRPDVQLRAEDNVRLLFKGEEKGQGHSLADAREVCAFPMSCTALTLGSLQVAWCCFADAVCLLCKV